jgi:hypothetical protein
MSPDWWPCKRAADGARSSAWRPRTRNRSPYRHVSLRVPQCQQKRSGGRLRLFHDAIGFDLDEPRGIDEARNLHKRASRANVAEDVAMRASCIAPSRNVRQHDPRPNDVRYCSARLCDGFPNDFKATDGLPVDITGSRGIPRRCNRCCPCNNDELANSYSAAKANLGLEIRPRRDEFFGTTPTSVRMKPHSRG